MATKKKDKESGEEVVQGEDIESFDLSEFAIEEEFFDDDFEDAGDEVEENLLKLLCFKLADEEYAIDIMSMKEIVKLKEFTEVPRSPDFIMGIISLRGIIIPIFDLRKRLGLDAKEYDRDTRIVIATDGSKSWGMIVDAVIQVITVPEESIEPTPAILSGISAEFISGISMYENTLVIIMNIKNVLDINL